jgi:ADP-heptose:LPS heptosyltransferase
MEMPTNKILLVQLYSNGDCLYVTTVARQIKKDFPDCHLTWAIAAFCKDIIKHNPYVDDVLVVNEVPKNNVSAFRKFRKKIFQQQKAGLWDKVIITSNVFNNQALYDGTIRGMILRAYPGKINVPFQPVLVLSQEEKSRVADFASKHRLAAYKNVILWEYAPQSGQSLLDFPMVKRVAEKLTSKGDTCVILSAANSFEASEKIIDASVLSVRENAELSQYCNLLIGSSSGITWLCTSSAGKLLPMVQLLNPKSPFLNAPSVDFNRYGIPTNQLIELIQYDEQKILYCVQAVLKDGVAAAKERYHQKIPTYFITTRKIVYNLLCYGLFKSIAKHVAVNYEVYGFRLLFVWQFFAALLLFPFKLIYNVVSKRLKGAT